jgi:hypothetical protein
MAFCPKCGKPFEENAANCAFCGAKNPAAPAPAVNPKVNEIVNKAKSLNKKNVVIVAVAAIAIIAVISLLASLLGGGYKKAIDNFFAFSIECDADKLDDLAPAKYWDELEDEYDVKLKDIKEEIEESFEEQLESLEDYYGKNIKVKYDILDKEELDEDDLDEIKDELKEKYGISKKSVKKALEVEVEATIKGKDDEDTQEQDMIIVKIDNKWYITDIFEALKYYAY